MSTTGLIAAPWKRPAYLPIWLSSKRVYFWTAIGITCLGFIIRLMGLDKGIWLDEHSSLTVVFDQNFYEALRSYDQPPLYFILLKLWYQIQTKEEFLRLLPVFLGTATIAVLIKWLKPYSELGSLLAGLYFATLPIMVRFSQEIRGYSLLLLATVLAFFFASCLVISPRKLSGYIGLSLSLSSAIATNLVGVMLIPTLCLYIALHFSVWREISLKRAILAIAVPCGVFIFLFFFFLKGLEKDLSTWWGPPISLELIMYTGERLFGIDQATWPLYFIKNHVPNSENITGTPLKIIVISLCVILLAFGNLKRTLPLLSVALFFWGLLGVYSLFQLPIFWYRTALPGMIPFIAFAGLQIATVPIRKLKALLMGGFILLCLVFTINWVRNEAGIPYEEWKQLAQTLEEMRQPKDLVLFHPDYVEGPINYYIHLPAETYISIPVKPDTAKMKMEISQRIAELRVGGEPLSVFVIIRSDGSFEKQPEFYNWLVDYLASEFGEPSFSKQTGILSISKYGAAQLSQ